MATAPLPEYRPENEATQEGQVFQPVASPKTPAPLISDLKISFLEYVHEAGSLFAASGAQSRFVDLRFAGEAVLEPKMPHRYKERVHAIQRREKSLLMQRRNLFDQRQRRSEHILRPNAVSFTPLGEKIAQFPGVFWRAVLKHGWFSHWAAPRA